MQSIQLTPWLLLLLLPRSQSEKVRIDFQLVRAAPKTVAAGDSRLLGPVSGPASCQVECAADPTCQVVHRANSTCRLGNRTAWTDGWSGDAGAVSYLKMPKSELLAGLANCTDLFVSFNPWMPPVASPGSAVITRSQVTEGSRGLRFFGNSTSYVNIEPVNFRNALSGNVTFFVKFIRNFTTTTTGNKALLTMFNSTLGLDTDRIGSLTINSGLLTFFYLNQVKFRPADPVLPIDDNREHLVSLALVANIDAWNATCFVSGVQHELQASTKVLPTYVPNAIRLGYATVDNNQFDGEFICFAMFSRALSAEEVTALDTLC